METFKCEASTLIEAVKRYVTSEEYPKLEVICAILDIEPEDKKNA